MVWIMTWRVISSQTHQSVSRQNLQQWYQVMSISQVFIQVIYVLPYLKRWVKKQNVRVLSASVLLLEIIQPVAPSCFHLNVLLVHLFKKITPFSFVWNDLLTKAKLYVLEFIILALHNSSLSPSSKPISPSCPKFHTSEITLLPADLLSHRAFSAVIPDSCRSCGAKIDLHPCVFGSAKQTLSYYSASLLSYCQCVMAAEILLSKHEIKWRRFLVKPPAGVLCFKLM